MVNVDRNQVLKPLLLGLTMVITGSVNTIAAKWADSMKVDGKYFNHPFVQAICMFVGELLCLFVYIFGRYIQNHRAPDNGESNGNAFCDVVATSIMYIGLNLTQASSFQMLRGQFGDHIHWSLFSRFLRLHLQVFHWLGISFVTIGLVIVGISDIILDKNSKHDINGIITGDLLIIIAQIIVAIQMVVEQKFVTEFNAPPLFVVGLEGLFGLTILVFLLFPMYYIKASTFSTNPHHRLEDIFDAFKQVKSNPWIGCALLLTMISIAFFNFAGVSVTKNLSATTRMVLDSIRILFIWVVSIPFFGEHFIPLQILPLITNNWLASCCISFCGIDLVSADCNVLVEDNNE
ncbi:Solute carrier family 35 member F6 [Dirofilaria immitis]|nr:Solute carrier family 35 member F6 [Dirofilaria immitis]